MSVFESVIGWLAPPHCVGCGDEGSALCISCLTTEVLPFNDRCWRCSALTKGARTCPACRQAGGPRAVWITTDYQETAQQLVQLYKFDQQRAAAQPLAAAMTSTLVNSLSHELLAQQDYLIVPVPTATSRIRQRGFDHSALMAKLISKKLGLRYTPILGRLGQTRQLGATRDKRLVQLAESFFVKSPAQVVGRNILLIDDVITTGGTITEASKTLRAAGARHVDALVFAKKL